MCFLKVFLNLKIFSQSINCLRSLFKKSRIKYCNRLFNREVDVKGLMCNFDVLTCVLNIYIIVFSKKKYFLISISMTFPANLILGRLYPSFHVYLGLHVKRVLKSHVQQTFYLILSLYTEQLILSEI